MSRSNALSRGSIVQMITALHRYLVGTAQPCLHLTGLRPEGTQPVLPSLVWVKKP